MPAAPTTYSPTTLSVMARLIRNNAKPLSAASASHPVGTGDVTPNERGSHADV